MDACNFPELLANDLEFSNLIFAAKNLSAGAPSPALGSDEGQWQSSATLASAAPQQHSAVRFQSTEPKTEEKTQFRATQHELSDSESISSGPSFSEVEPASSRQLSVITAATSVTGGRNSVASHKRLSSLGHNTDASWIDLEPDMTAEDDGASIDGPTHSAPVAEEMEMVECPGSATECLLVETRLNLTTAFHGAQYMHRSFNNDGVFVITATMVTPSQHFP
ncbi:hypothetical protein HYQ45_018845 [Verticillium longisporum]|uniref:Uncharacterized protein n=1 Tax=Verticillium longisporum TaxID=100787 RepID=A0A8I2ZXK2_VERLO|nr:hypothetical protein HYQ45_018845 [Verticillium longisporum]